MCRLDILGKCAIYITRDILGKCAISRGISWANIFYKLVRLLKKDDVVRLVDIYNSDKMFNKSNHRRPNLARVSIDFI